MHSEANAERKTEKSFADAAAATTTTVVVVVSVVIRREEESDVKDNKKNC